MRMSSCRNRWCVVLAPMHKRQTLRNTLCAEIEMQRSQKPIDQSLETLPGIAREGRVLPA
jgi:hypothetical protein